MCKNLWLIAIMFLLCCSNNTNQLPVTANIQSILKITYGYAKIDPTLSSILITRNSMSFKKDSLLTTAIKDSNGNIMEYRVGPEDTLVMSWSKSIIDTDFESIALLIVKNKIIGMPDLVRNPGPIGGLTSVIIQVDGRIDTVNVYPGAQTPERIEEVFAEINSLQVKYEKM